MSETKKIKTTDIITGKFTLDLENKKVIIESGETKSNILLDDISSMGVQALETSEEILTSKQAEERKKAVKIVTAGIFFFIVAYVVGTEDGCVWHDRCLARNLLFFVGIIILIIGFIRGKNTVGKEEITIFDKVTLETKGGKDIIYYTQKGEGEKNVSSVEKARISN